MLESLLNQVTGLRAPTKMFSCGYCKMFKNRIFYKAPPLDAFVYSNKLNIFREKAASKFQGQHATQFNRYEGLCPATKTGIRRRFFSGILPNFRAVSFENNFEGLLLKRK